MRKLINIVVLLLLGFPAITIAQQQSPPFGSFAEVERYFNKNLRYPHDAMDKCQTGYVLLKFEVDGAGRVSKIEKVFSEHLSLLEELWRVTAKTDGKWGKLFKKNTVVLLPCYFMYRRHDNDPPCDNVKAPAVLTDDNGSSSAVNGKQILIPNGIMLSPIVVIVYTAVHKKETKLETSNTNK